jgi:hypothetical protein
VDHPLRIDPTAENRFTLNRLHGMRPHLVLALALLVWTGCDGVGGWPPIDSALPGTGYQLEPVEFDGVHLQRPRGSRVVGTAPGERGGIRILGPMLSVRPAAGEGSWTGAAYSLEINTHPNPEGFSAEEWAQGWLGSATALGLDHGPEVVGGRIAYRVNSFGGDSQWVHLVVPHGDRIAVFSYIDAQHEINPIAAVSRDAHALLLATVRFAGSR